MTVFFSERVLQRIWDMRQTAENMTLDFFTPYSRQAAWGNVERCVWGGVEGWGEQSVSGQPAGVGSFLPPCGYRAQI